MATVLITGIAGFAGSHLADLLLENSTTDIAGVLHPSHEIQKLHAGPHVKIHRFDILQPAELARLLEEVQPDAIYHLAGMAHVHESWTQREETLRTNFFGAFHLLEACRNLRKFPRVLLIGSAECYGNVPPEQQPITESHPFAPATPYAVSKIAQEMLGIQYAKSEGYPVYMSRSFNHTGPRQKETFVCSAFAKQIALAEAGLAPHEIKVGNLSARRDFTDVRDVVRAYVSILENGKPGEPYNVCSGAATSIQEVLDTLLRLTDVKFKVTVDPERFRPVDMPLLLGSADKLQAAAGWKPRYNMESTLSALLNYWRERVGKTAVSI